MTTTTTTQNTDQNTDLETRSPQRHGLIRRHARRLGLMAVVGTMLATTLGGAAFADVFNSNLHHTRYTWSDCSINVGFVQDTHDGARWGAIAGSQMACNSRHNFYTQQVLTFNGVIQPGYTSVGYWKNAYGFGGRTLETQARCGAGTWGSILYLSLDGSGWYALSNTPQYVATAC